MFEVAALFTRTGGGDPDMSSLLFLIAVGVVVCLICRPQPARDAAAAQSWAAFHHYTTGNGWTLLYVQNVYQHAQRGSKAMVSIYGDTTGTSRDAWFWWEQVQHGSVVAVSHSQGWGPHTNRDVLASLSFAYLALCAYGISKTGSTAGLADIGNAAVLCATAAALAVIVKQ